MLGEPVTIPYPDVVGVRLTGRLRPGVGATDLALTLTELPRATGVVNKFVEFCGDRVITLGWAERAAVSNMAPEYGATCVFFPYDDETAAYLRLSGREEEQVRLVDAYLTAQASSAPTTAPSPATTSCSTSTSARSSPAWPGRTCRTSGCRCPGSRPRSGGRQAVPPPRRTTSANRCPTVLPARIKQCSYTGARFEYQLAVGDLDIHAESPVRHEGQEINLLIRPEDCLLYPVAG